MATIERTETWWSLVWWTVVLRGLAAIAFGVLAFVWPGISLAALVLLFGAYAFVDGIFNLVDAFSANSRGGRRWVAVLQGLVGLGAGIVTFLMPALTMVALLSLVAAWALLTGALEIAMAIRLRKVITHEWLMVLSGVLSIALGIALIIFPIAGLLALILWISAYAIVFGALLLALGFKLRRRERDLGAVPRVA